MYPVSSNFYEAPVMLIERAAATHFGIKAYGIHVNGYVVTKDRGTCLWVARRSKNKPNWPGKLDHIVAGGQVCKPKSLMQIQCHMIFDYSLLCSLMV